MSQGPENTFIAGVHKYLPPEDDLHREGMHNPYRGGTADVWYSGQNDLWVEYKYIDVPTRDTTLVDLVTPRGKKMESPLSALQQQWLERRHKEGRNVAVIVGCKEGGVVLAGTQWMEPMEARVFRRCILTRKEVAEWIVRQTGTVSHASIPPRAVSHRKDGDSHVPNRDRRAAALLHGTPVDSTPRTLRDAPRKQVPGAKARMGAGRA